MENWKLGVAGNMLGLLEKGLMSSDADWGSMILMERRVLCCSSWI